MSLMISDQVEHCRSCPRLVRHLAALQRKYPGYHNRPVSGIGEADARVLIVGLAPGLHGANATGLPFTGDASGKFLFDALQRFGFARYHGAGQGWQLQGCRITNAVKCLPPNNRPIAAEFKRCSSYLTREIASIPAPGVILALGHLAYRAVLNALAWSHVDKPFAHGAVYGEPGPLKLMCSYHCSRYNTQTRRLTQPMFDAVLKELTRLIA